MNTHELRSTDLARFVRGAALPRRQTEPMASRLRAMVRATATGRICPGARSVAQCRDQSKAPLSHQPLCMIVALSAACRRLYNLSLRVDHTHGGALGRLQGSRGPLGIGAGDVHRLPETSKLPESVPCRPGGLDLDCAAAAVDIRAFASVVWDTLLDGRVS